MEGLLGIGELARAGGLPVSALRFYDGAGVLVPAAVDPRTGYRRYRPEQVGTARLVARLRRVGMPLDSVRALLAGCDPGPVLDAHLARLEGGLADARRELSAVRSLLLPEVPVHVSIDALALADALDTVRFAIGTDPQYPHLAGVLVERSGDRVHVVATDRYRLAVATVPAEPGEPAALVLPVALVDEVRPLLTDGTVTVRADGAEVEVTGPAGAVRGTPVEGAYPDWRRLEPSPMPHQVRLDGSAFRTALAEGPATRKVREDGVAYDTVVLVLDETGELAVGGPGDGLRVGVNRDFLLDALGGHDQLVLELDGPITPLAVRVPGGADWSLLMPVNLDDPEQ